jgi:hypothetical protein
MLIKPCTLLIVKGILRESEERKVEHITLWNDTMQRRLYDISFGIKLQVLSEIK